MRIPTTAFLEQYARAAARKYPIPASVEVRHQLLSTAGIDADAVVLIDVDLQDPPEMAYEMVAKWREDYEVYGTRSECRGESAFKLVTARRFYRRLNHLQTFRTQSAKAGCRHPHIAAMH